jgi:hypothetical protein
MRRFSGQRLLDGLAFRCNFGGVTAALRKTCPVFDPV